MSSQVQSVVNALHTALDRASGTMLVRDADFGETLRIGQIIKGRVMRHYEGGRYLVEFSGQEKLVDSTVALRTHELVSGRVVALGEQVHLQRLHNDADAATALHGSTRTGRTASSPAEQTLLALFAAYNAQLAPAALSTAAASVERAPNAGLMALSALVLTKLGLRLSPELLQAMYQRLSGANPGPPAATNAGPRLDASFTSGDGAASRSEPAIAELGAFLHKALGEAATKQADTDADETSPRTGGQQGETGHDQDRNRRHADEWRLGQWLLGLQSHPRINHRLTRIPLWLGERLVEVSVALFSEAGTPGTATADGYQRVVFYVATERLGRVQVTVNAAGMRLRITVASDSATATDALARHLQALEQTLSGLGWQVDDIRYLETRLDGDGAVLENIVHHHITQDSLSRLM